MQELCCLNGVLLELVTQKEEEEFCLCMSKVFLLADHFRFPLFWGSGLLGHSEAPHHVSCFS